MMLCACGLMQAASSDNDDNDGDAMSTSAKGKPRETRRQTKAAPKKESAAAKRKNSYALQVRPISHKGVCCMLRYK